MTEPYEDPRPEEEHDSRDDDAYPDKDDPEYQQEDIGPGGYDGRDVATDMPRIPGVPETQDK